MDPYEQFCHTPACPDRGQSGLGNIRIHSRKEQRYRCSTCGRTFAATTETPFYRLRTVTDVVILVLTLLCHGCPLQAIVAAFGFDERTVREWQARAGEHCQHVHCHLAQRAKWIWATYRPLYRGVLPMMYVELWVKMVGQRIWMAMAFRSALAPLTRRGRAIAHKEAVLTAGMYLSGCAYSFCWYHDSLRLVAPENASQKWLERTPAMAAGLTDHRWSLRDLLLLKVPRPPGVAPKCRGRLPKQKLQPIMAMAA